MSHVPFKNCIPKSAPHAPSTKASIERVSRSLRAVTSQALPFIMNSGDLGTSLVMASSPDPSLMLKSIFGMCANTSRRAMGPLRHSIACTSDHANAGASPVESSSTSAFNCLSCLGSQAWGSSCSGLPSNRSDGKAGAAWVGGNTAKQAASGIANELPILNFMTLCTTAAYLRYTPVLPGGSGNIGI